METAQVLKDGYKAFCWACDEVLSSDDDVSDTYEETRKTIRQDAGLNTIDYNYYFISDKDVNKQQRYILDISTPIDDCIFSDVVDYIFREFCLYQDTRGADKFCVCDFAKERLTIEFKNSGGSQRKSAIVDFKPN